MNTSKLKLSNIRDCDLWLTSSVISSACLICLSGYGNFQKVSVYQKTETSNEFGNFSTYALTKEFDRENIELKGYHKVASITQTYTYQKLILSGIAATLGVIACVCADQQERHQDIRNYHEVKQTELDKFNLDVQMAAHTKIGGEKAKVHALTLSQELLQNRHYKQIVERRQATLEGRGTEEEEETQDTAHSNTWGSLAEDDEDEEVSQKPTTNTSDAKLLTEQQVQDIVRYHREEQISLLVALEQVTGYERNSKEFKQAALELRERLKK